MSISYEEALSTLQSMFGDPWTIETLDAVLRHQQGHMENTVDLILRHGDRDPQILVDQLQSGIDPRASNVEADEQLARILSGGAAPASGAPATGPSSPSRRTRGTPTTLPADFLRIPSSAANSSSLADDEALARMLQDELFSEELARNPDFAHLARPRRSQSQPLPRIGELPKSSNIFHAQQQRSTSQSQLTPQIMLSKISELGDNARRKLQLMAAQFQAKTAAANAAAAGNNNNSNSRVAAAERRGLLDHTDDDMELAARKDL